MGKLRVNAEATRVEGAPLKLGCYVLFDFGVKSYYFSFSRGVIRINGKLCAMKWS